MLWAIRIVTLSVWIRLKLISPSLERGIMRVLSWWMLDSLIHIYLLISLWREGSRFVISRSSSSWLFSIMSLAWWWLLSDVCWLLLTPLRFLTNLFVFYIILWSLICFFIDSMILNILCRLINDITSWCFIISHILDPVSLESTLQHLVYNFSFHPAVIGLHLWAICAESEILLLVVRPWTILPLVAEWGFTLFRLGLILISHVGWCLSLTIMEVRNLVLSALGFGRHVCWVLWSTFRNPAILALNILDLLFWHVVLSLISFTLIII